MVQVSEPYSRIDSTVAWNRLIFRSLLMSDYQIVLIPWQAAQALAFLTKKSCLELAIHDPGIQISPLDFLNTTSFAGN